MLTAEPTQEKESKENHTMNYVIVIFVCSKNYLMINIIYIGDLREGASELKNLSSGDFLCKCKHFQE